MKTRSLIITLSVIASILVLLFSYVFKYAAGSKDKLLLQDSYVELKIGTTNILQSKTTLLEKFVFDNSYWTELLNATSKADTTWFNDECISSVKNYGLNYIWILNEKGNLVYNKDVGINNDIAFIDIDTAIFLQAVKKNPFQNFYIKFNGSISQIIVAPIQPTSDAERLTKPAGYLICGKRYDAVFLKEFSNIVPSTNFNVVENIEVTKDSIDYKKYTANYKQYFNNFFGEKIAALQATKNFKVIGSYNENLKTYILLYLIFLFILLVIFYHFLRIKVLNPIGILSNALSKKDGSKLDILKSKKDEFADLAYMIDDSFVKNEQLQLEVDLRKKTEEELKKSAFELERATIDKIRAEQDKIAKAEFLSTMSHEIRTPINGVIGVANLLKSENLTPSQRELVNTLSFSSNHLLSVLTDILDFSKIESGNISFDSVQFNLNEICKNVIGLYGPSASAKSISLTLADDNGVAEYLHGDSVRLCQILNNLVGNAIKFTDSGKIILSYKLIRQIDNKQTIEFSIKDTGIGIVAEKLHTIFDSFSQADKSITTNYGGTGLGLAITKKLIELQGGTIAVDSIVNEGTVFTFHLSFDIVNTSAYQAEKITREQSISNLNGLRVLVAEDNKINALILNKFLLKWNATMELAINGEEVIEKLKSNTYDLILMDLHMPIMDGREATKTIRESKDANYNAIPIIALTADATSETQKQILALGFNEYVTKPFNPNNLYAVLEKFCVSIV
jgi:signal transduction histidine kinase/CheY-like chemotaxis protein/sensor domain CHASE-containing protein